jgi:DNA repair exonuclease SbcCD nuclease subunit
MRVLHTADWQIGLKAKHVASAAEAVRSARLEAGRHVIQAANRARVEAVIVAGDLFDDNLVGDALVRQVVDILAASEAPVFVLPGNHDPLTPDSVYRRYSWRERPARVVLLDGAEPVSIPGVDAVLLASPCTKKKSFEDPTRAFCPRPPGGPMAIGVAHGSLRIEGKHSPDDFPIALDAAERAGLDYLALGHWHGCHIQNPRLAYPGTHEATAFGEVRSGQALLVEIEKRGAIPRIEEVPTGSLTWISLEADLSRGALAALAPVRALLTGLEAPKRTLLRLRTRGQCADGAEVALRSLGEELASRLLFATVDRADLPTEKAQGRLAEIAASSALVAGLLEDLAQPSRDGQAEITPSSAAEARRLLDELVLEVWP